MLAFRLGKVSKKFPNGSIRYQLQRALIEAPCLKLHELNLLPDGFHPQGPGEPDGAALDETFNVLRTNQWDVFAEALAVSLNQPATVFGLFRAHLIQHFCRGGVCLAQPLGEVAEDASVFLFQGNCQSEDFPLGEVSESFRHYCPFLLFASVQLNELIIKMPYVFCRAHAL